MSLITQVMVAERYGLRLDMTQLAAFLDVQKGTVYNQISAGTCKVRTYVDGGKRWADARDVVDYLDAMRKEAA